MRILVLGAGRMGSIIAQDLSKDYDVVVMDHAHGVEGVESIKVDLEKEGKLPVIAKGFDLIVSALPSEIAPLVLYPLFPLGKKIVDVSYATTDWRKDVGSWLSEKGTVLLTDAGVAPGLTNLVAGRVLGLEGKISEGHLYVGGFARDPKRPYGYVTTWSPSDLEEEYTRPARYLSGGRPTSAAALSGVEEVIIPGAGMMEAFLTDGLRSLLELPNVKDLVEKTVRWPGHAKAMRELMENGTFLKEIEKCTEGDDMLVFHCIIDNYRYNMVEYPRDGMSAMQRTTALTCASFARLLVENDFPPGVVYPEDIGQDEGHYKFIVDELAEHKVQLSERRT